MTLLCVIGPSEHDMTFAVPGLYLLMCVIAVCANRIINPEVTVS